jgi:hypothetical protein
MTDKQRHEQLIKRVLMNKAFGKSLKASISESVVWIHQQQQKEAFLRNDYQRSVS